MVAIKISKRIHWRDSNGTLSLGSDYCFVCLFVLYVCRIFQYLWGIPL